MTDEEYRPYREVYLQSLINRLSPRQASEVLFFLRNSPDSLSSSELEQISQGLLLATAAGSFLGTDCCNPDVADILRLIGEMGSDFIGSRLMDRLTVGPDSSRRRHRNRPVSSYQLDRLPASAALKDEVWLEQIRPLGRIEKVERPGLLDIEYLVVGEKPSSILIVELHGDENAVWPSIQKVILEKHAELGDFILVWHAHSEAVLQGNRCYVDQEGTKHDLNRKFPQRGRRRSVNTKVTEKTIEHPKARQLYRIFQRYPTIRYVFTFHTENDFDGGFYMYDIPLDPRPDQPQNVLVGQLLKNLQKKYRQLRIPLHDGLDDPSDNLQRNYFHQGYRRIDPKRDDHSLENFPVALRRALRAFCFETPMQIARVDGEIQDTQIRELFVQFLLPFLAGVRKQETHTA